MLRLVHPPPVGGHATAPSKDRRSPALLLTVDEQRHLRITIKNTARAYGGMDVLASVLGLTREAMWKTSNERRRLSGTLAIRVAKAAGMSVEAVLNGQLSAAGRCPTCGSRVGDKAERRAAR